MASVFVGVLTTGWLRFELTRSLIEITHDGRYVVEVLFSQGRPTSCNCNRVVKHFLASECDYLLMMASDTSPYANPLDLVELDLDIVAMACPIWRPTATPPIVMNATPVDGSTMVNLDDGLIEVTQASASVMLIARRVLEHPDLKVPFASQFDEFGITTASDDITFFQQAREAGLKVWVSLDHLCGHIKEVDVIGVANAVMEWRQPDDA